MERKRRDGTSDASGGGGGMSSSVPSFSTFLEYQRSLSQRYGKKRALCQERLKDVGTLEECFPGGRAFVCYSLGTSRQSHSPKAPVSSKSVCLCAIEAVCTGRDGRGLVERW